MLANALTRLCEGFSRVTTGVTIAILIAILAINATEIVSRTFLAFSFQWIYETNLLLASWLYFLGIFLVYRHGGDITMVGLRSVMPPYLRGRFERLLNVVSAGVFLMVAWYSWNLIALQWPFKTPGVGIPRAAFTIPLLIGTLAVALQVLSDALSPRDIAAEPEAEK